MMTLFRGLLAIATFAAAGSVMAGLIVGITIIGG